MSKFNKWFTELPEGEQKVLREDKWMLAERAYEAALTTQKDAVADVPLECGVSFDAAIREVDTVIKSLKWFKTSGIPEDKKPVYAWAADLFVNLRKELCKMKN